MAREAVELAGDEGTPSRWNPKANLGYSTPKKTKPSVAANPPACRSSKTNITSPKTGCSITNVAEKARDFTNATTPLVSIRFLGLYYANRKHKGDREFAELNPARLLPKASAHFFLLNFLRTPRRSPVKGAPGSHSGFDSRKITKVIFFGEKIEGYMDKLLPALVLVPTATPSLQASPLSGGTADIAAVRAAPAYQRASCVIWTRLPQVSFSMAIVEPVTSVGGIVNSAPRVLMRS